MSSGSFKNVIHKMCLEMISLIHICIKKDLVLNNLQRLICHKTIVGGELNFYLHLR